ncbi:hypothetical protein PVAP13_4NG061854 [Panicum virgatum]|uniref:Uncharacterized protein n=1 Tax=Panicum virgatum TaxID=38727 RepID=A0A8T0T4G9_PANVG|nr:hypothetical protein PVAP13_4NG061854 [Panicum virgatum]
MAGPHSPAVWNPTLAGWPARARRFPRGKHPLHTSRHRAVLPRRERNGAPSTSTSASGPPPLHLHVRPAAPPPPRPGAAASSPRPLHPRRSPPTPPETPPPPPAAIATSARPAGPPPSPPHHPSPVLLFHTGSPIHLLARFVADRAGRPSRRPPFSSAVLTDGPPPPSAPLPQKEY